MDDRDLFDDDRIQAYIEGRLSESDEAAVVAYLRTRPRLAADVEQLRRQNDALKSVGQEILDEPIPERLRQVLRSIGQEVFNEPVPEHLRQVLQRPTGQTPTTAVPAPQPRRGRLFAEAALALLLLCAGAAVGWILNARLAPPPNSDQEILAQLANTFAFYGHERDYPLDFPADRSADFADLLVRAFGRPIAPPDLSGFKFTYAGGRLEPVAGTRVGLFEFQNPDQLRLAVFFWRGVTPAPHLASLRDHGADLQTRFWLSGDLNFALIADKPNHDFERVAATVAKFYDQESQHVAPGPAQQ